MNEPVDMTKCQPGDLLKLRDGRNALYVRRLGRDIYPHAIIDDYGDVCFTVHPSGSFYVSQPSPRDVVAIIHPTRAELEGQRWELLVAVKGALAALSQPMTYPADIAAAKRWLADAAIKAEATHG